MGSSSDAEGQRRGHVRAELSRQCAVRMQGQRSTPAELVDLSGTGCAFVLGPMVEEGDTGTITISFDDWTLEAGFEVRFVRSEARGFRVGAVFTSLLPTEVDRIVREVFVQLRNQLRGRRTEP
jgi:c-di-GMP-binding flagellar brake protein YcgR